MEAPSERDERIDGYHDELTRNLLRAHDLRLSEPDLAIQLLRQAAEGLCYCVLLKKNRIGIGDREELGPLIERTASFLRNERETLDALRQWGNRSSHAQGRPAAVSVEEATALFLMTARPVRWLHREILGKSLPDGVESRYEALVLPPRRGRPSAPFRASKYMMIGVGLLAVALVAVLLQRVNTAGAGDASPAKSSASAPRAEYATTRMRKLEAALDSRDEVRVANLYAEPTTVFGRRFETRADVARWVREHWNANPDEKATFFSCRKVGSVPRGDVFACDGAVTRRGTTLTFTECVRWSPDHLIEVRETAPPDPSAGCASR